MQRLGTGFVIGSAASFIIASTGISAINRRILPFRSPLVNGVRVVKKELCCGQLNYDDKGVTGFVGLFWNTARPWDAAEGTDRAAGPFEKTNPIACDSRAPRKTAVSFQGQILIAHSPEFRQRVQV
jgi:hypothetical protein